MLSTRIMSLTRILLMTSILLASCQGHRNLTQSKGAATVWINEMFFKRMVDFAPKSATNDKCNTQSDLYKTHLRNHSLWAVTMHESNTLTLGGILTGNTNQFGHPYQCVETIVPELAVRGQYCLALAEMQATFPVNMHENQSLAKSVWREIFTRKENLIRHPRSSFRWGLCVPSECSAQDLQRSLNQSLSKEFQRAGIELKIQVSPEYCYSKNKEPLPIEAWCFLGFVTCLVILVVCATMWDYLYSVDTTVSDLSFSRAFSIIYNTRRLCKVNKDEELTIIYGMKCLTMFMVIIGHKSIILFGNNIMNKERLEKDSVSVEYLYFLNGSVVVDTFFVISGYLGAHQLMQHFSQNKSIPFILVVLDRIVRILPTYALVISFYVWFLPYMNEGPLWKSVVVRESNRCHTNWWTNILFINNFVNDDQMCMLQSWFLAVDFQLFVFSFFIIYLAWRCSSTRPWLLGVYLMVAMTIPGVLIYQKQEWSFFIPSISNLYDPTQVNHFRDLYTKTYTRAIPYVIGIIGAFYRRRLQERKFQFSSGTPKVMIFIAVVTITHAMFLVPFLFVSPRHPYNVWEHVVYGPLHRVIWAIAMCHFIVMHNTGGYGLVSMILGCKVFAPLSRLCYGVYLTHIAVMLIELGSSHTSEYFTLLSMTQKIFGDLSISLMASFVLNMVVESPLDTFHKKLKRTILGKARKVQKTSVCSMNANKSGNQLQTYTLPSALVQTLPSFTFSGENAKCSHLNYKC